MPNPLHTLFGLKDDGTPLMFLAPIAGYSNAPMRRMSQRHGASLTYTEMASARGLLNPSEKTWSLLETDAHEGPVVAHLFGSDPSVFAEAAARVEQTNRFVAIDLNTGCPAWKVMDTGSGAALINDPQRIHDIVAAMRKSVRLPIIVKTRLGPSPDNVAVYETLAAVEAAGASMLTLHGRFTTQGHRGQVNVELIGETKRRAKIPIVGNGDVHSCHSAWQMFEEARVDAVMIARAAIGNPWIFSDLRTLFTAKVKPVPHPRTNTRPRRDIHAIQDALDTHLALLRTHLLTLQEKFGISEDAEAAMVTAFRCHLFRYLHSLKGAGHLRGQLHKLSTLAAIRHAVTECLTREAEHRAEGEGRNEGEVRS